MESTKQRRRAEILEAAGAVFAERGYHQASINDIIDRAGIARGTFYLYFPGKHQVFGALLEDGLEQLRERIKPIRVGDGAPPPGEQLRANVLRVLRFVLRERDFTRLVLGHGLAPDDEVAERVAQFWRYATQMVEASLRHGITLGMVRECDVELVAQASLGAIRGVVEHLALGARSDADLEAVTTEVIAFAMQGVLTPTEEPGPRSSL